MFHDFLFIRFKNTTFDAYIYVRTNLHLKLLLINLINWSGINMRLYHKYRKNYNAELDIAFFSLGKHGGGKYKSGTRSFVSRI